MVGSGITTNHGPDLALTQPNVRPVDHQDESIAASTGSGGVGTIPSTPAMSHRAGLPTAVTAGLRNWIDTSQLAGRPDRAVSQGPTTRGLRCLSGVTAGHLREPP